MLGSRSPSPPATPPPRLAAQDNMLPEPSPSKLIAVHEEETNETVEKFSRLLLEEQEDVQTEIRHPRPSSSDHSSFLHASHTSRSRNVSPFSRPHLRSQSTSSSLNAPPMLRAHSSPAFASSPLLPIRRSSSPLRSPKRSRSPFGSSHDETYLGSSAIGSDIGSIDEEHELDITPRPTDQRISSMPYTAEPLPSFQLFQTSSFPIRKRRPASPLYHVTSAGHRTPTSNPHSPALSATKFNEAFPNELTYTRSHSSASSMPSTPTSVRSRSPSISSLETIADTPDEEEEAIEAENLEKLRRASEGASEPEPPKRRDLGGFGNRDKRKRWSVCGAEKRSDLNLETIWED